MGFAFMCIVSCLANRQQLPRRMLALQLFCPIQHEVDAHEDDDEILKICSIPGKILLYCFEHHVSQ